MSNWLRNNCRLIKALAFLAILWAGFFVTLYEDVGEYCELTGSRRMWREYPFGIRTSEAYEISALEESLRENSPRELEHRWVRYLGNRISGYGLTLTRGHGSPVGLTTFRPPIIEDFVQHHSPQEIQAFHQFLKEAGEEEREAAFERSADEFHNRLE